jgi:hypothetical protein
MLAQKLFARLLELQARWRDPLELVTLFPDLPSTVT